MIASIRASSVAVGLALFLAAPSALAQNAALAETLFRDAKALMAQKDYAKACPKLAESQRLDPGTGTMLLLAFCHEKEGKTATAWADYQNALGSAQKESNAERESMAKERIKALEPKLAKLTLKVDPALENVAGFELKQDGEAIGKAAWGTPTPVDPGEHEIKATAPGRNAWSTKISVKEGEPSSVSVPDLVAVTESAPLSKPEEASTTPSSTKKTVGLVLAGLGVVSIGVGGYFGFDAISKADDVKGLCNPQSCGNQAAFDLNDQASTAATISTITIGVGLAAVAVGAILYLTSGGSKPAQSAVLRRYPTPGSVTR